MVWRSEVVRAKELNCLKGVKQRYIVVDGRMRDFVGCL